MRARWAVIALAVTAYVVAGCYHFNPDDPCAIECTTTCPDGLTCGADGLCHGAGPSCPAQDAGIDGPHIGSGSNCYGTGLLVVCFAAPPTGDVPITGDLDTTPTTGGCMGSAAQGPGEPGLCVFAGSDIAVSGQLRITGSRPLVLVATGTITVGSGAVLDAGSQRAGALAGTGPDADDAACDPGTPPVGSGGGAGGSFQATGGNGGSGPGSGGRGGTAGAFLAKAFVHGGCKGQPGTGDATSVGHGGGAVYLIAVSAIEVTGQIDASGGGAAQSTIPIDTGAGSNEFPGGGGGAGGMIGLDAPAIHIAATGILTAGGGGGAGGGGPGGGRGQDGNNIATCGAKGQAGPGGGDGGSGSCNAQMAGNAGQGGATAERGYGGGGGAAGYVLTFGAVQNDYVMGSSNSNVQPSLP